MKTDTIFFISKRPQIMNKLTILLLITLLFAVFPQKLGIAEAEGFCPADFVSVATPLNDLGNNEYVRLNEGPTGYFGGLYPNGKNVRPPAHEAAGLALAEDIVPLNAAGNADPLNGKIVMISVGMSNTSQEFQRFLAMAATDGQLNPKLAIVNGAQGSQVSNDWADSNAEAWNRLNEFLADAGVSPQQVQVAWVKQAQFGAGDFPAKAQSLQSDLEATVRNLKTKFPNIKIAFHSSRTRSYLLWSGLSPEPTAYETGFAVKWMIEKQLNGDPDLNYDPTKGSAVAPYLAWGPYLWIDGLNARSDGLKWFPEDLNEDCTHPSEQGKQKVADQLMYFFKTDSIAKSWFLADPNAPPPPPPGNMSFKVFLPFISEQAGR